MGLERLLFFLLILFAGFLHLCTLLLLRGVDSDDSKADSPDIKATVDVIEVAFLDEFGQLKESGL